MTGTPYTVFGYKGKQVRDNIHSHDLVNAFWHFYQAPRPGEVYNIGGEPPATARCWRPSPSCEEITGRPAQVVATPTSTDRATILVDERHPEVPRALPGWDLTYTSTASSRRSTRR